MNRIKNMKYAYLAAYILVVALFFTAGFVLGNTAGQRAVRKDINQTAQIKPTDEADEAFSEARIIDDMKYAVVLEGGRLIVYETENGKKTALAEHEISESVFPKDDIAALKSGMKFADKNEAMAMFENFAS